MRVLKVDPLRPDPEAIRNAAEAIRSGGLVIFPTETVYGLGANALDAAAVQRVFEAKGRPADSPLAVQVGDKAAIAEVTTDLSATARRLIDSLVPGPITLVMKRSGAVPPIVSGGRDTIGVRVPDNPVALALLKEVGGPIVATSANRSSQCEPSHAAEAVRQIGSFVDVVLDAGPGGYGVASTVVDTTVSPVRILRRGALSVEDVRRVVGEFVE